MSSRPDYGIDSPAIVIGLFVVSVCGFAAVLLTSIPGHQHPFVRIAAIVIGFYFLLAAGGMIWYSKVGKFRIRDSILSNIPWRGDEIVLDVGCGREHAHRHRDAAVGGEQFLSVMLKQHHEARLSFGDDPDERT